MKTSIQHVALEFLSKEKADIFFKEILGLNLVKNFKLSKELSKIIFDIDGEVDVLVYQYKDSIFEVFITISKIKKTFNHVCIQVDDKDGFVKKCEKNNLNPLFVNKGDKKLLFVRDFSDNLYEIK